MTQFDSIVQSDLFDVASDSGRLPRIAQSFGHLWRAEVDGFGRRVRFGVSPGINDLAHWERQRFSEQLDRCRSPQEF